MYLKEARKDCRNESRENNNKTVLYQKLTVNQLQFKNSKVHTSI